MPRSPLADAEALFLHALQPVLDLAALGRPSLALLAVGIGAALAMGLGAGLAARVRATSFPTFRLGPMTRTLPLLLALVLAATASAQTHADAMARLAPFAGTYALDGAPHQDEGTFDGTLTITPILDGHFQQWDWAMTMRGDGFEEPAALRFIVGYDVATSGYTVNRFDSRDATSPTRSAGVSDPALGRLLVDGDGLVMAWTMAEPGDDASSGTFRNLVRVTDGGLHIETEAAPDDGSPAVAIATTRAARR